MHDHFPYDQVAYVQQMTWKTYTDLSVSTWYAKVKLVINTEASMRDCLPIVKFDNFWHSAARQCLVMNNVEAFPVQSKRPFKHSNFILRPNIKNRVEFIQKIPSFKWRHGNINRWIQFKVANSFIHVEVWCHQLIQGVLVVGKDAMRNLLTKTTLANNHSSSAYKLSKMCLLTYQNSQK